MSSEALLNSSLPHDPVMGGISHGGSQHKTIYKRQPSIVRALVFPVVMYGCESWALKKADAEELMLLNCGVGKDS